MRSTVVACCLCLLALSACSDDASSPVEPIAAPPPISADLGDLGEDRTRGPVAARVVGSLIRAPHSWPIVNWSTIRGLNATLDENGDPGGSFDLEIEIDFGAGAFLQRTTEEVICVEIAEREDGRTRDIWIGSAAEGWVTVPPGVTHYAIQHIVDSPGGDLFAARSIPADVDPPPSQFCKTRPDLSTWNLTPLGPVALLPPEAGNAASIDRR